jgi:hypothetical protein
MAVVGGEAGFYAVLGRRQTDSDGVMGLGGAVCSQLDDVLAAIDEHRTARVEAIWLLRRPSRLALQSTHG